MNFVDVVLLLPLIFAAWWGFSKGLIIEIATLLALVLGLYGAHYLADKTAFFLTQNTDYRTSHLHLVAFLLTFIGIVAGVYFMAKVMESLVTITGLGIANRIAGAVFGILKMSLILSGIIYILKGHGLLQKWLCIHIREESLLIQPISLLADKIIPKISLLFS